MENKEVKQVVKNKNGKFKPLAFINITLKLFFIDSFNKLAQSNNKRVLRRKIKKANKHQIKEV